MKGRREDEANTCLVATTLETENSNHEFQAMTFLLLTITGWNEPPRARHQVARALARRGEVVFVARNKVGAPGLNEVKVEPGITIIEPSWPVDSRIRYRLPGLNHLYQSWLLRNLRRRYREPRVIAFDHTASALRRYFPDYLYFCNDDLIGNSKIKFVIADLYHRHTEKLVASHARAIVATSPYLVDKLSRYNPRVHELPLGAPSFSDEQLAGYPHEWRKAGLHLGLVGFMGKRTPIALLKRLLALDGASLSLIGPVDRGFAESLDLRGEERDRVRFLGVLTGDELLREIANFDVAIAPYNPQYVNRGGTPNKLWQYLAVGRPTVVTSLPAMAHWSFPDGCVYVADDEDDFVRLVGKARAEDSPELANRRIACARENSWDRRIDRLLEVMDWQA